MLFRTLSVFGLVFALGSSVSAQEQPFGQEDLNLERPHHEDAETAPRVSAYLPVHGAGETRIDFEGPGEQGSDLGAAFGLGVRFEMPLFKYFAIGALWELLSVKLGGFRENLAMDFDVLLKGRYVFGLTTRLDLEAYAAVPIGLSWMHFGTGPASTFDSGIGINTGFQGGATAIIDGRFGVFTDLGFRMRRIFTETGTGNDVTLKSMQLVWSLGGVYLF